jgi:DNA-binding LytR/AlgR family response regulator
LGNATDIKVNNPKKRVEEGQKANQNNDAPKDLLLVKKLGKEFLIKKQDIAWAASSGNYVNLYINDEVFPMRTTLTAFLSDNKHLPIERVHRSFAVNLTQIDNIELQESGDGIITLKSGNTVKMSRRYRLALS